MSFGSYLAGVAGLALVLFSIALASVRWRAWLLPAWTGAPARMAEAVIGASLLTVLLQLLGAVGLIGRPGLLAGSLAVGLATELAWRRRGPGAPADRPAAADRPIPPGGREPAAAPPPPSPSLPRWAVLLALAGAAFLAAHWATGLQDVWARGMFTFDTLWYHGPYAARMAEEGSAWTLHYSDPEYLNWLYPQNSELLHSAGIALFDRDLLSPLINFGWLGLALLAAWCIGRPYGVAPLTLVAVAIVLDTGPMVPREAGTAANDVAPVALLLAAIAVLVNAWAARRRDEPPGRAVLGFAAGGLGGALLVAGLAAGLALGTKLTVAGGVAALALGAARLLAGPGARWRAFWIVAAGVAVTSAFWFVRDLVHTGSPLPWLGGIGPLDLPGPDRLLEGRDPYSVAHYLFFPPQPSIWRSYFFEATRNLLGPAWPLIAGGALAGVGLALVRPRSAAVRLAGVVAVAAAVSYLFTPLTAAGPEGQPVAFSINFRYLVPALALGLALLPLEPRLTPERWRPWLLAGGLAALVLTSRYSDSATIWDEPFTFLPVAALAGILFVAVPWGLSALGARSAGLAALAGGLVALLVAGVGWARQDDYLADRYASSDGFRFQLDDVARWAKPTENLRIAVAGTSGAYNQYAFYGDRLSNHVQYLGGQTAHGGFEAIEKCAPFREALNAGGYDYLVTTPTLDLNDPQSAKISPERGWVVDSPSVHPVLDSGRVAVFRIDGELDPDQCLGRSRGAGESAAAKG